MLAASTPAVHMPSNSVNDDWGRQHLSVAAMAHACGSSLLQQLHSGDQEQY
jgi:hypothetical protein